MLMVYLFMCIVWFVLLTDIPGILTYLQVYGAAYLQKLLEPLLRGVITTPEWQQISFEVDPTR